MKKICNLVESMGCRKLTYYQKNSSKTESTPIINIWSKQCSDNYLFGMLMPGRSFNADGQRHLYHGMEQDVEVSGSGNSYTTEFRQYDPRLGRWKSLDPLMSIFPDVSPYNAFSNNPIVYTDPNGLAPVNGNNPEGSDDAVTITGTDKSVKLAPKTMTQIPTSNGGGEISYYQNKQGFYIEGSSEFGDYIGNVKPDLSQHYELTEIDGGIYHKHEHNAAKKLVNYFDNAWDAWLGDPSNILKSPYPITNRKYDAAEESFNEAALFVAELYITGVAVTKLGTYASSLLRGVGGSIWKLNPLQRGFVYEEALGGNLARNYPVIDKFYKGVGTSIKTLDVTAKTYTKNAKAIYNKMKKYVDDLHGFEGTVHGGVNTTNNAIKQKVLEIGIPRGATKLRIPPSNYTSKVPGKRFCNLLHG